MFIIAVFPIVKTGNAFAVAAKLNQIPMKMVSIVNVYNRDEYEIPLH